MSKQRRATEQLNVALAGIEAGVRMLERFDDTPASAKIVEEMRRHVDAARQSLSRITAALREL